MTDPRIPLVFSGQGSNKLIWAEGKISNITGNIVNRNDKQKS